MATTAVTQQPYSTLDDGDAGQDATEGFVTVNVTLTLTGSIANVQADWAALLALGYASPSVLASNDAGGDGS